MAGSNAAPSPTTGASSASISPPEAERVHKRIWRVAEDDGRAALADLSARESKQLMSLAAARQEDAGFRRRRCRHGVRRPWRRPQARFARRSAGHQRQGRAMTQAPCERLALIGVPVLVMPARWSFWLQGGRHVIDRERLRQGRHHPDRQRSAGPHHRAARSATTRSSRRATCWCASIPRPTSWRWPRPRPRSIPRAPRSSSSRRACARSGPRPRRPRTSWRICRPRPSASAICRDAA